MKILYIGDIFGKSGVEVIRANLSNIKQQHKIDLTIANVENTTNCRGLNFDDYNELVKLGIDYMTMGNHSWRQNDWRCVLKQKNIIRPFNIIDDEKQNVGSGSRIIYFNNKKIRITNLIGTSLQSKYLSFTNPFVDFEQLLKTKENIDIDIVDFHAETTSEKNCFLYAFKGLVTIIVGTHTHVQTNDARIVDNTAYITDLGMTGPHEGVIGAHPNSLVDMFFGRNEFFKLSEASGKKQLNAVIIEIDDNYNVPNKIQNIFIVD